MLLSVVGLLSLFCSAIEAAALPLQLGAPIQTTSGIVSGTTGKFAKDVSAYLGIPFAQPPVGSRRWLAPEPYLSNRTIEATKIGPDCPGTLPLGQSGFSFEAALNEDCLTLNVWAKPYKEGDSLKPVMVWIYGGAFIGGSAGMELTDGSLLSSRQDVVVMAMNYRLSVTGFPGAPGLADQNLGILDQRLAVEWARDNSRKFGGDPNQIVLFGQSAGSASVDIYSYAWVKDPIVKGFIGESGGAMMCGLVSNTSRQSWPQLVTSLKCNAASNELACMRGKSTRDLMTAAGKIGKWFPPSFVPIPDGKVIFDDYPARASKGLFIKAPYIIGNNERELGGSLSFANEEFTCPSAQIANARRQAGINTWRYRFYAGYTSSSSIAPGILAGLPNPAMHGAEMSYVFGTLGSMGILGAALYNAPTPQKIAVSEEIQKVWAAFARDPNNGPTKLGWPVYEPKGNTLVRLMHGNETLHSLARGDEFDASCAKVDCANPEGPKGGLGALLSSGSLGSLFGLLGKPGISRVLEEMLAGH